MIFFGSDPKQKLLNNKTEKILPITDQKIKYCVKMAEVDPETLLEWLQMGQGDERDMQLIALEQLCMLLLMSDNVDRCFESCPPRYDILQ